MKVDKIPNENQRYIKSASQTEFKKPIIGLHYQELLCNLHHQPYQETQHIYTYPKSDVENIEHAQSPLQGETQFLGQMMPAEYQTITTTPLSSNQILFQGELKALWVMSSKEKMLQYFKNRVTGNLLQSFQQFKSDSPRDSYQNGTGC